jgi:hypothetical protein
VTPDQAKRLRELPRLIAGERDPEKLKLLAAEMRDLTTLELDEMRSKFNRKCPTCGTELGVHTTEMLEECARKQREVR